MVSRSAPPTTASPPPAGFHLTGGRLCLDFANTRSWRPSPQPTERLRRFADVVRWGRLAGALAPAQATRLERVARARPAAASAALRRAVAVREAIYRVFSAVADGATPPAADLAALGRAFRQAVGRLEVVPEGARFELAWRGPAHALDEVLWPVLRSAMQLLATEEDLRVLKKCGSPSCGWLFVDTTRNKSRRWCDMRVCGNRSKVRRYQRRQR
jgi:predicted RNA-binding Zn ribbon-like protein